MKIARRIDRLDQELIEGRVLDRDNPSQRLSLEVLAGFSVLGRCTADLFRKDLSEAGIGDGHCAFSLKLAPFLAQQQIAQIRLKLHESDVFFIPSTPTLAGAEGTKTDVCQDVHCEVESCGCDTTRNASSGQMLDRR